MCNPSACIDLAGKERRWFLDSIHDKKKGEDDEDEDEGEEEIGKDGILYIKKIYKAASARPHVMSHHLMCHRSKNLTKKIRDDEQKTRKTALLNHLTVIS